MVVSTDIDATELIFFALRFAGHKFLSASSVEECVDQASQFNPELILLDDTLPEVNVIDANRYLKSHEITANVPIFLFTSNGLPKSISDEEKNNFDRLVLNRISPDQLTDKVNSILKGLHK